MTTTLADYPEELMWANILPRVIRLYDNKKVTNWSMDFMYKILIELGADAKYGGKSYCRRGLQDLYASLSDDKRAEFEKLITKTDSLL